VKSASRLCCTGSFTISPNPKPARDRPKRPIVVAMPAVTLNTDATSAPPARNQIRRPPRSDHSDTGRLSRIPATIATEASAVISSRSRSK
jgi:hypothetical protein